MLSVCRRLGDSVAPEKCAGPSLTLVFLGFELDTNTVVVRLPSGKLQYMLDLVHKWMHVRRGTWSPSLVTYSMQQQSSAQAAHL